MRSPGRSTLPGRWTSLRRRSVGALRRERLKTAGYDLEAVAGGPVSGSPATSLDASCHVDEASLFEVAGCEVGELAPQNAVVELGRGSGVRSDPDGCDVLAISGLPELRVGDEASDQGHLVDGVAAGCLLRSFRLFRAGLLSGRGLLC